MESAGCSDVMEKWRGGREKEREKRDARSYEGRE